MSAGVALAAVVSGVAQWGQTMRASSFSALPCQVHAGELLWKASLHCGKTLPTGGTRGHCVSALTSPPQQPALTLACASRCSADDTSSSGSDGDGSAAAAAVPDGDSHVATVVLDMPRRSLQVTFSCDKCGAATFEP